MRQKKCALADDVGVSTDRAGLQVQHEGGEGGAEAHCPSIHKARQHTHDSLTPANTRPAML